MGARTGAGRRGLYLGLVIACRLFGAWLVTLMVLQPTTATSQDASSAVPTIGAPQQPTPQDQAGNTGDDFDRPPPNLFQLMYDYKTARGSGSALGTTSVVTSDMVNLRADHRIDLAPQWELALRGDLPLLAKNPITSDNPDGNYLYGVGGVDIQAALMHEFDERWTASFGARLIGPGEDTVGTGKWQIMPGLAVRYALSEINSSSYLEPLVRYDVSFAGGPSNKNISNLQFAPTFNLGRSASTRSLAACSTPRNDE